MIKVLWRLFFAVKVLEEADFFMKEKQYDKAEAKYLEGVEKDPSNFFALNNLGVIAMNIRMNYDDAEKYFNLADEISSFKLLHDNIRSLKKLREKTGR